MSTPLARHPAVIAPHNEPVAVLARLGRRIGRGALPGSGWSPPPLAELIARIDQALAERQAG